MSPGSWRWMERFHCSTVACLKFGSMTTVLGADPSNCGGGERKPDGFTPEGAASSDGKPCERRTFGTPAQPGVVDAYVVAGAGVGGPGGGVGAGGPGGGGGRGRGSPPP